MSARRIKEWTGADLRAFRESLKTTRKPQGKGRFRDHLSRAEFAKRFGVTERTLARWENGEVIPIPLAIQRLLTVMRSQTRTEKPTEGE